MSGHFPFDTFKLSLVVQPETGLNDGNGLDGWMDGFNGMNERPLFSASLTLSLTHSLTLNLSISQSLLSDELVSQSLRTSFLS